MPLPHARRGTRARRTRAAAAVGVALAIGTVAPAEATTTATASVPGATASEASARNDPLWAWPLAGPHTVSHGFEAPADRYSAGHRGIDLPAAPRAKVVSPTDGVVSFSGVVVDRPVLTLRTADGTLISLEPVSSELPVGTGVLRGQSLGTTAHGGHCADECLHLGVRVNGQYVSPMQFFGGVRRAVLLPLR